jgi:hypothetical protein
MIAKTIRKNENGKNATGRKIGVVISDIEVTLILSEITLIRPK